MGSARPVPGGGSAAAAAGAMGAELGSKVGRIVLARRRLSSKTRARMRRDLNALAESATHLRGLIREDAQAYAGLVRALAEKRGIPAARKRAIQSPLRICEAASRGRKLLKGLSAPAGPYLASDLKAAEALLRASVDAARAMVEANSR